MGEINDAFNAFSQKMKRFTAADENDRKIQDDSSPKSHDDPKFLQEKINEREERLKSGVVSTYKIYRAPFSALGTESDRAKKIDYDQQALLRAYKLFDGVQGLNDSAGAGYSSTDSIVLDTYATFIKRVEISSALAQKAVYTSGGQFIYLVCWLYFEQNCRNWIPFFVAEEKGFRLAFAEAKDFKFDPHDKEIFDIIQREFYSGENS